MEETMDDRLQTNGISTGQGQELARLSHDLRTPMSTITGFAKIALGSLDDKAKVEDCLQKILQSGDHLYALVNDILDKGRIESGKVTIANDPFDLGEVASWCAGLLQIQAQERQLDYSVDSAAVRHPLVVGDSLRLKQVLQNISDNAVKFTPAGGRVSVTFSEEEADREGERSWFLFRVQDTGCGMSPEFMERLYEPYSREGLPSTKATQGTGLGMCIMKSLVELMGGTVAVESQLGEGTTVLVRLPFALQETEGTEAAETAPATAAADGWEASGRFRDPATFAASALAGRRLLVADDDDLSREVVREVLAGYGIAVAEATDGSQVIEMLKSAEPHGFDAILMDMHMPLLDGIAATQAIRSMDREDVANLPVIAITADAFAEDRAAAAECGLNGYVTKPFDTQELLSTLQKHVLN